MADQSESEDQGNQESSSNETGEGGPSTVEKGVMVISTAFTLALFAFVIWQAVMATPGVAPQASVVDTQSMADGGVAVTVRLRNPSDVGLQMAVVEVDCASPPPAVQFQNVPAADYEVATVKCPRGTSNPDASVSWWIEA